MVESDMDKVLSEIKIQNAKFGSQIIMIKWIVSWLGFSVLAAVVQYIFFS